jgi:hypothetical protein
MIACIHPQGIRTANWLAYEDTAATAVPHFTIPVGRHEQDFGGRDAKSDAEQEANKREYHEYLPQVAQGRSRDGGYATCCIALLHCRNQPRQRFAVQRGLHRLFLVELDVRGGRASETPCAAWAY